MLDLKLELGVAPNSRIIATRKTRIFKTRYSLFLLFTMIFVLGNSVLQRSANLISLKVLLLGISSVLCLGLVYLRLSKNTSLRHFVQVLLIVSSAFSLGYSRAWIQATNYLNHSLAANVMALDLKIPACISSLPSREGNLYRFIINPIGASHSSKNELKRIRLSVNLKQLSKDKKHFEFLAGECWLWDLRLKTTRGLRNQHGFDYEKWLYQQNIGATAYLRSLPKKLKIQKYPLLKFRANMAKKIDSQLPDKPEISSLILGLTLGIRDNLSKLQWQVLQKTGTSHLLAISGLHVGIAAIFGFYFGQVIFFFTLIIFRNFVSRVSPLSLGLSFGLLFAIFYAALSGFSVSTQRACIMLIVATLALLCKRRFKAYTILSFALITVLLIDPKAILSSGTFLSFIAVVVLIYFSRKEKMLNKSKNNLLLKSAKKINKVLYLQVVLVMLLSIPVALTFASVSTIAPLVNLVLIPLFTITVVPVLLMAVLSSKFLPVFSQTMLLVEHAWLAQIWGFLEKLASFNLASIDLYISFTQICLCAILLAQTMLPKYFLSKRYLVIIAMPLLFGFRAEHIPHGELKMTVFDVGQGLSVLLQTENYQLLYDTGPAFRSGSSSAQRVIQPWLKSNNINTLSAMVISHSDNDHAGGADFIRKEFQPFDIYSPKKDKLNYTQACEAGKKWMRDGVTFEFLYPFANTPALSTNNLSCVLKVSVDEQSILLTGDIEKEAERVLIRNYADLHNTIVFVPHHGSRSSSTKVFTSRVHPQYAIVPAGFANRWRFPKEEVLQAWLDSGAQIKTLSETGELSLTINPDEEVEIKTWISENCRYWHQDCL